MWCSYVDFSVSRQLSVYWNALYRYPVLIVRHKATTCNVVCIHLKTYTAFSRYLRCTIRNTLCGSWVSVPLLKFWENCLLGICRIDFFLFWISIGSVFEKKSDSVWNEFASVWFQKCGSDIIVIYYSCNSWVVNLQQILQRQWMTWLWLCHSQQWQQVNNIIAF